MSADGLRVGLERLLELWRRRERNTRALNPGDVEFRLMANEIKQCIMELEGEVAALLHAHPPDPTVVTGVFCDYMIGVNPCLLVSGHAGPHIMQFPDESAQNPPALLPPEDDQP
jgi:hypothetical protein